MRLFPPFLCIFLVTACSDTSTSVPRDSQDGCVKNMRALSILIVLGAGNGDTYPANLGSLVTTNTTIFVCPNSSHPPGVMTNVDNWTDYVYVSGRESGMWDVALLICPPENHRGRYGHVIWGDRSGSRLPADKVRALIREPWCMPRTRGVGFDEFVRPTIKIHVPSRFHSLYAPPK
jgi:hypothetical protein